MKEFMFIFRFTNLENAWRNPKMDYKMWQDWIGGIAAQNKLSGTGEQLDFNGNVVKSNNVVTNGPYAEIKETLGGYMFVKAESLAEATEMAKGCPIIQTGAGSVEVRPVTDTGNNG
ncbi:MAG: transcription initiation protein [Ignavibacteriales bacterium]|nr:transcription initiation protein [Ignavibacteriales bacterium]